MSLRKKNRRETRGRAGPPGVIVVIMLLAIILLASLVLYVLNIGQQVNTRVLTQNSADAAAVAGGGYIARSFNTVAMNNTGMAQLIAGVNVLDAMPLTMDFTYRDQTTLDKALNDQLRRNINGSWVREALEKIRDEVDKEVEMLTPVDQFFNHSGYDVREDTYYKTPAGKRGRLWESMESLDHFNDAVVKKLGELAQSTAIEAGDKNLPGNHASMLVPVHPSFPIERGAFDDFALPVLSGLLKAGTDDKTTNRGPFDTVFGWRDIPPPQLQGYWQAGSSQLASGGHGSTPISTGASVDGGKFIVTGRKEPTTYTVYGPFSWTLRSTHGFWWSSLYRSRFYSWVSDISNIKMGYLWPRHTQFAEARPTPLRARGYKNDVLQWDIQILKDYRYWFDGPGMLRTTPASSDYYLEDGVNTTSDDLILHFEDLGADPATGKPMSRVTYRGSRTASWRYDIVGPDGSVILGNLGAKNKNYGISATYETPLVQVIKPDWRIGFQEAVDINNQITAAKLRNQQPPYQIVNTRFIAVEIKSKYPRGDPNFLSAGSWQYDSGQIPERRHARVVILGGWMDPRLWLNAKQVSDYIWRDEWEYKVFSDAAIGIPLTYAAVDADGKPIGPPVPQTVYRIDDFMFAGINVGKGVDVLNPHNFESRDDLPAPTDFDHLKIKPDDATDRRQFLTLLGAARHGDTALNWSAKFNGNKPYANMVALAQVQVYNNHSFDLWTQMWGAQVEPISDYRGWLTRFDESMADLSKSPALNPGEAHDLYQYLNSLGPFGELLTDPSTTMSDVNPGVPP